MVTEDSWVGINVVAAANVGRMKRLLSLLGSPLNVLNSLDRCIEEKN